MGHIIERGVPVWRKIRCKSCEQDFLGPSIALHLPTKFSWGSDLRWFSEELNPAQIPNLITWDKKNQLKCSIYYKTPSRKIPIGLESTELCSHLVISQCVRACDSQFSLSTWLDVRSLRRPVGHISGCVCLWGHFLRGLTKRGNTQPEWCHPTGWSSGQ